MSLAYSLLQQETVKKCFDCFFIYLNHFTNYLIDQWFYFFINFINLFSLFIWELFTSMKNKFFRLRRSTTKIIHKLMSFYLCIGRKHQFSISFIFVACSFTLACNFARFLLLSFSILSFHKYLRKKRQLWTGMRKWFTICVINNWGYFFLIWNYWISRKTVVQICNFQFFSIIRHCII